MCVLLRSTLSGGPAGLQPALTAGIVQEACRVSTQAAPAAGLVIAGNLFGLTIFAAPGRQSWNRRTPTVASSTRRNHGNT
jgi:hypothetical protein